MTWNQIRGKWSLVKGKAKATWSRLSDRDLVLIRGIRDHLIEKLQDTYGWAKADAEKQVARFARRLGASIEKASQNAKAKGRGALRRAEEVGRAAAGQALRAASAGLDRVRVSVEHPKTKKRWGTRSAASRTGKSKSLGYRFGRGKRR
ncbi:MAG TPA: hypothetical protein VKW04_21855 [Planctomycetota bacterium]|nr:hypothetical protein [Planctomycetota bacterium]